LVPHVQDVATQDVTPGYNRRVRTPTVHALILAGIATLLSAPGERPDAAAVAAQVREFRRGHEAAIIGELTSLLSIPNVASDAPNIRRNAALLEQMLVGRGFRVSQIPVPRGGPVIVAELPAASAAKTVLFYAHYDGQPVDPAAWTGTEPFKPALRTESIAAGGRLIPFPSAGTPYQDAWRIYARSASDDKSPIVALLTAVDALEARKMPRAVNVKLVLDGEEEAGSPGLEAALQSRRELLAGDLLVSCDGPVRLAQLLASMKNADGRVLVDGFYDDVVPLTEREKQAVAALPAIDADLMRELQFGRPEGGGTSLADLLGQPSLNIRGLRSAYVGADAQNVVPEKAEASIDIRLVKNIQPERQFRRLVAHIQKQAYFVVEGREPTPEERRSHPAVARVDYGGGYPATRFSMDLPASIAVARVLESATGGGLVKAPTLGGSVPMYIFERLGLTVVGVPIVNYDNSQHSHNENLRLGEFWRGIEVYAALIATLDW
jgi:acetylornithine deacetylase/succinyl-diaminopimelate desuccinylase-like protein